MRCLVPLNKDQEATETLPKCIIPQKAHITSAQIQASNGSRRFNVEWMAWSMLMVIGGWMRHLWFPCKFSSPCRDQLMQPWSSYDNGDGKPWAKCQANTATRYFWMTETETNSNHTSLARPGVSIEGSVATHKAKEWRRLKEAGRWTNSGIVKISQKRWNLQRPEP